VKSDCVHPGVFEYKCVHSYVLVLISHLSVFLWCEMKALCQYISVMPSVCLLLHYIVKTYVVNMF